VEEIELRLLNYYYHLYLEGLRKFSENFTPYGLPLTRNLKKVTTVREKKNTNHSKVMFTKLSHSLYRCKEALICFCLSAI